MFGRRIGYAAGAAALIVAVLCFVFFAWQGDSDHRSAVYEADADVEEKVSSLLQQMTLKEKLGQMVQGDSNFITPQQVSEYYVGSVLSGGNSDPISSNEADAWHKLVYRFSEAALDTRLRIPLLYGIDAVHGHNNVVGATLFPHNIGLGATGDAELVQRIGAAVAREIRATGIPWTFAPCVCVPQDERWGRTYEGFGEQPQLVSDMGTAFVLGLQGYPGHRDFLHGERAVATLKHWIGDGATEQGIDQGDVLLDEEQLRLHMDPFAAGIEAGARAVMVSYSSWNGLKTHADRYLITDVLKGEMGFNGIVISDWNAIDQISTSYREAVKLAVNAGIDMVMAASNWHSFLTELEALVQAGEVEESRIDDAVSRVLRVKYEAGLFEEPLPDTELLDQGIVGSPEHRELAREAVRKSLVLLKNEGELLPLARSGQRILVAGPKADSIGYQSGGWTVAWQGGTGNITRGTTILEGIQGAVGNPDDIVYSATGEGAGDFDAAVVVIGEPPYAEGAGDRDQLALERDDLELLDNVRRAGKPMAVIMLSGRPMIVTDQLEQWDAFVAAWLPGTEGAGVADALFGEHPFTGTLPMTWPKSMEQIPTNVGDAQYDPLFPLGYGLTNDIK